MKKAPRICYLDPGRDYVRVKKGFSWPAFFFGALWASAKKTWGLMFLMLFIEAALYALGSAAQATRNPALALAQLGLGVAYWIGRGAIANAWWRASLRRRGYQLFVEKPGAA